MKHSSAMRCLSFSTVEAYRGIDGWLKHDQLYGFHLREYMLTDKPCFRQPLFCFVLLVFLE